MEPDRKLPIHKSTSQVRLLIERADAPPDPNRVLVFDPADPVFIGRFYRSLESLNAMLSKYQRAQSRFNDTRVDELGLPKDMGERIQLMGEACEAIRNLIDDLFGAGTAQMLFGDVRNLEVFQQFFVGITPIIKEARSEVLNAHVVPGPPRKGGKKRRRR